MPIAAAYIKIAITRHAQDSSKQSRRSMHDTQPEGLRTSTQTQREVADQKIAVILHFLSLSGQHVSQDLDFSRKAARCVHQTRQTMRGL